MPIHYRCPFCDQLLSITTRKAGVEVPCPLCGESSVVPFPDEVVAERSGGQEPDPILEDLSEGELERTSQTNRLENPAFSPEAANGAAPEADPSDEEHLRADSDEDSENEFVSKTGGSGRGIRNRKPALKSPEERESGAAEFAEPSLKQLDVEQPPADEEEGGIQLRRASPNLGDLDLTSMVDVTFLLLIFFMVTASFSLQKTIELPKPNADQKGAAQSLTLEDLQANTIFVKVDEANQILVDDVPAGDAAKLEDVLTQARLTTLRTEVAIDAHPEALHETVVRVIDAATAAGMQKVRIVSRTGAAD